MGSRFCTVSACVDLVMVLLLQSVLSFLVCMCVCVLYACMRLGQVYCSILCVCKSWFMVVRVQLGSRGEVKGRGGEDGR